MNDYINADAAFYFHENFTWSQNTQIKTDPNFLYAVLLVISPYFLQTDQSLKFLVYDC